MHSDEERVERIVRAKAERKERCECQDERSLDAADGITATTDGIATTTNAAHDATVHEQ